MRDREDKELWIEVINISINWRDRVRLDEIRKDEERNRGLDGVDWKDEIY